MSRYRTPTSTRLKSKGGVDFVPPAVLMPRTEIMITGLVHPKRDGFGAAAPAWYQVLVLEGAHKDKEGFLQSHEIAEYELPLPDVPLLSSADVRGTRYGMVKKVQVDLGDGNGAAELFSPWDERCKLCNEPPALHVLPSSTKGPRASASRAQELLQGIQTEIRSKPSLSNSLVYHAQKEVMIGVLTVMGDKTVYAGHSGQKDDAAFGALCKTLGFVYAPPLVRGMLLNRRHERIADDAIQNFDYQCAAPRLIQKAVQDSHYPVAMTEIYGGGPSQGNVIPSCGRCQKTVPYMLCPE